MRPQISALALAASLLGADAIHLSTRSDGTPARVVQHDVQRRHVPNPIARDRLRRNKRSKTILESLTNEETLYFANVTMGTPAQSLRLHIDTGSSDLWVNVADSTYCSSRADPCSYAGTYAPNSSSTYEYVNGDFNITYVDGSGSAGDYATDTVRLGGATLDSQQFGIGYTSSSAEGIIGIGYTANEASVATTNGGTYANVPVSMVSAGLINTNAYSLWLNDLDASTGSILFGGVDTSKYTGDLETLPIVTEQGVYAEFIIALTAVGINGVQGSIGSDLASPALLDSGSSLMYLPNAVTQAIYDAVGAEYDSSEGAAFVDCSLANNSTTIDFTFSTPTISVAMSELVIVAGTQNGADVCILGISPADGSTPVLGDTFLRSAYVVYDLANNEISLAQTNFDGTTADVQEITKGTTGVPGATAVTNAVTAVSVETGGAINGGQPTDVTSSAGAAVMTGSPFLSYGAMAAAAGAGAMYAL